MTNANSRAMVVAMASGCLATGAVSANDDRQAQLSLRTMKGIPVGHIYYNMATGERVVTLFDSRPRGASDALWLSNNTDPCATGAFVGIIDDVDLNGDGFGDLFAGACVGGTFPCEGSWLSWWGDIAFDCVIDTIVVAYGISAPDLDVNSDSIGDGIVGYDLTMTFSDNDNGFQADLPGLSGRSCILDLTIPTISGAVDVLPPGFVAIYIITVDLAPTFIFELGDSNGIDQAGTGFSGAALYGPSNGFLNFSGQDKDGDELADFSFAMRFDQSSLGTSGTPGISKGANGYVTVAPKLGNPGDLPPSSAPAFGIFDAVDVYSTGPSCPPTTTPYIGTFFFGGFSCDFGIPFASSYLELYGERIAPHCQANFDGSPLPANFTDIITFLSDFPPGPCTPGIGNFNFSTGGVPTDCNFTDVTDFLTNYSSAACGN